MTEVWRKIDGYPYQVSDMGRVRRSEPGRGTRAGRILRPGLGGKGYPQVILHDYAGDRRKHYVHRLVAKAFIGPCPAGKQVNHKDGVKADNCVENLEYVTPSKNVRHAFRLSLRKNPRGEQNPRSKLTEADVQSIRLAHSRGEMQKSIAERYGVVGSCISEIVSKKRWKHVISLTALEIRHERRAARLRNDQQPSQSE